MVFDSRFISCTRKSSLFPSVPLSELALAEKTAEDVAESKLDEVLSSGTAA